MSQLERHFLILGYSPAVKTNPAPRAQMPVVVSVGQSPCIWEVVRPVPSAEVACPVALGIPKAVLPCGCPVRVIILPHEPPKVKGRSLHINAAHTSCSVGVVDAGTRCISRQCSHMIFPGDDAPSIAIANISLKVHIPYQSPGQAIAPLCRYISLGVGAVNSSLG